MSGFGIASEKVPTMKSIGGVKDENGVSSKPSEEVKTESEKIDFSKVKVEPLFDGVYDEISGHSDIFYCKIKDKIICAPNSPIIKKEFLVGTYKIERQYPKDVAYNACQIGENIIGSKFTDVTINPNIIVKQGYTKCSISVTGKNSCILEGFSSIPVAFCILKLKSSSLS